MPETFLKYPVRADIRVEAADSLSFFAESDAVALAFQIQQGFTTLERFIVLAHSILQSRNLENHFKIALLQHALMLLDACGRPLPDYFSEASTVCIQ